MRTSYPEDYKGPRAGVSDDGEWLAVREFQAFRWIRDNTWFYADFDCWLIARDRQHYDRGFDSSQVNLLC
jgi:hypothetical protein